MDNKITKTAALNALGTALYICIVASGLFYGGNTIHIADNTVLMPIFVLSLAVFSAALTGSLMLGRPVLWYLDGKKKEAVSLLFWTLGFFFAITAVVLIVLIALPVAMPA